jgi:hypothetical protein
VREYGMSLDGNRLPDEMDELQLLFSSRGRWHGLSPQTEEESTAQCLIELLALRRQGDFEVLYTTIPRVPFSSEMPKGVSGYEWRMRSLAYRRPGSTELAECMWSGYSYLQGLYPGEELEVSRQAPHLYMHQASEAAITAGDLPVERTLKDVANLPLRTLGVVSSPGTWCREAHADRVGNPAARWDLALLTFSTEAVWTLQSMFEARRQRFIEDLAKRRAGMTDTGVAQEAFELVQRLIENRGLTKPKPPEDD